MLKEHPVKLDEPLLPQIPNILTFCIENPNAELEYDGCGTHSVSLVIEINDPKPTVEDL